MWMRALGVVEFPAKNGYMLSTAPCKGGHGNWLSYLHPLGQATSPPRSPKGQRWLLPDPIWHVLINLPQRPKPDYPSTKSMNHIESLKIQPTLHNLTF